MSCARWMSRLAVIVMVAALGAGVTPWALGAEAKGEAAVVKVAGHGDLKLMVPEGWTQKMQGPGMAPTITLSPKTPAGQKPVCEMLITAVPVRTAAFNQPDAMKKMVEARGNGMLDSSKETKLEVQELKGEAATGYVFTLTDKAPKAGEFEFVTEGCMGVGDLLLSVTILHHQKDAPQRAVAIEALKGVSQAKADAGAQEKPQSLHIAGPPGAKWEMTLGGGVKVLEDQTDDAHKARQIMAMNETSGMVVSVFFEPAPVGGDSTAVRNRYWGRAKNSPIPKKDIKLGKSGSFATVEYLVPDLQQKNMNVYIVHEGTWIDVHLSKVDFAAKDQPLFDEIVKSIVFAKNAAK